MGGRGSNSGLGGEYSRKGSETPFPKAAPTTDIGLLCEKRGVKYNEVQMLDKELSEDEIIEKLAAIDGTGGSCASVALAYIGNKLGYDVVDYRGGDSMEIIRGYFSLILPRDIEYSRTPGLTSAERAVELLDAHTELGKEYLLWCGHHAAIVRKVNYSSKDNDATSLYQYLELQRGKATKDASSITKKYYSSGWKDTGSTNAAIKIRFAAYEDVPAWLVDIDSFKNDAGFKEILGYINTKT